MPRELNIFDFGPIRGGVFPIFDLEQWTIVLEQRTTKCCNTINGLSRNNRTIKPIVIVNNGTTIEH